MRTSGVGRLSAGVKRLAHTRLSWAGLGKVMAVVVLYLLSMRVCAHWIRIDMCLDDGGRWSYETSMCERPCD